MYSYWSFWLFFGHNNPWYRKKILIDLGDFRTTCFQPRDPKMPTRVFLYVDCSLFICFSFFNESLEKCINDIMLLLPFSTSKESKMVKFQNFNFFLIFFLSNFDVTFCNLFILMGYWWTIIKTNLAILFQKRSNLWNFAYLKGIHVYRYNVNFPFNLDVGFFFEFVLRASSSMSN